MGSHVFGLLLGWIVYEANVLFHFGDFWFKMLIFRGVSEFKGTWRIIPLSWPVSSPYLPLGHLEGDCQLGDLPSPLTSPWDDPPSRKEVNKATQPKWWSNLFSQVSFGFHTTWGHGKPTDQIRDVSILYGMFKGYSRAASMPWGNLPLRKRTDAGAWGNFRKV